MKSLFSLTTVVALTIASLLNSCGSKEAGNDLASKKALLNSKKTELTAIQAEIKNLEIEIKKLEPISENSLKSKTVSVQTLGTSVFKHYITIQGQVVADNNVPVSARNQGIITKVYVKEGQAVKKGQVLAQQDLSVYEASMKELNTALELATTLYNKRKNLWEQKIGAEIDYLTAKNQKESLEDRMKSLKAQMDLCRVIAPMEGTIDAVNIKEGEAAIPGFGIFRLVNNNKMKVTAKVADTYIGTVKLGDRVNVKLPDINKNVEAVITHVSRVVDPLSRTFMVEVDMSGSADLRPNMLALVNINDITVSNAITIEENILQTTEQGIMAFVAADENGKKVAKSRTVITGLTYNGLVEIKDGLKAGDALITTGYSDLVEGTPLVVK